MDKSTYLPKSIYRADSFGVNKFKEKKKMDKKSERWRHSTAESRPRRARRGRESGNSSGECCRVLAKLDAFFPRLKNVPDAIIASPTCCAYRRGCADLAKSRILTANSISSLPTPPRLSSRYERRKENPLESPSRLGIKNGKKRGGGMKKKKKGADFY